MEDVLRKYKERLVNLSGKNRSLLCRKLPKKRGFDFVKLETYYPGVVDKLLTLLIKGEDKKCCILSDAIDYYNEERKKLEVTHREELAQAIEKLQREDLDDKKEKVQALERQYKLRFDEGINKLEQKRAELMDYGVSLKALAKEMNDVRKETGRLELYIGYPFIEGRLKDDTFIRSPLMLFPVELIKQGESWYVQVIGEASILLNKVLLLGLAKHNEIKAPTIKTEYEQLDKGFEKQIIDQLAAQSIHIQVNETKPTLFKEYKKENTPSYQLGELILKYHMVLGQFPIANSIYSDYEALLQMEDMEHELIKKLLKPMETELSTPELREEDGKLSFHESEINLISPLDYSQEKAVVKVNASNQLVIYGPPGTGKSQTITNIIGDALSKGKKILMVSQKRAALDVIYNRLGSLNKKVIIMHDAQGDKKQFYASVATALEQEEYLNNQYEMNIKQEACSIDEKLLKLEYIAKVFQEETAYGLSLQEMYGKCKEISSRTDETYEAYRYFAKHNHFMERTYMELVKAIEGIDEACIDSFKVYKQLSKSNAFIDDIDVNMNIIDIDELSDKVKDLMAPIKMITDEKSKNPMIYEKMMSLFKENGYEVEEGQIATLVKEQNMKENSGLLARLNNGKWWHIQYWLNYQANKRQEEVNRHLFEEREQHLREQLMAMYAQINQGLSQLAIIKKALEPHAYELVIEQLWAGEDLGCYFNDIIGALEAIETYRRALQTVRNITPLQRQIVEYATYKEDEFTEVNKMIKELPKFLALAHIQEKEKEAETQKAIAYLQAFDKIVEDTKGLMVQKQDNVRKLILNQWNAKISELTTMKGFKEFKRQANKKRALWPVRQYIKEYGDYLLTLFPCFLISPETACEILPLQKGLFDLVIFDEASQMYAENAMPVIYRGKQVIIAGDDKQLRPNGTFSSRYVEEEENPDLVAVAALEEESLLDLAKVHYDSVHLTYHYRSLYEELIQFSNYAFYNGRLRIAPNTGYCNGDKVPIERRLVNGRWIDRENREEAEEVVTIISDLFKHRKHQESIGIITFNATQKICIENALERRAQEDSAFREVYTQEIERIENNEDISLFIKNIENVQGDERDIIIFSTAYGMNEKERVSVNFGSLSQDGGENRLNVAISRAKKKVYVVTSIEPEAFNVDESKNRGPFLFKKYLQYAREVSKGHQQEAQFILNSVLDTPQEISDERKHDSDFEAQVYDALAQKGYTVHTQVGVSGYKIDLAIYDEHTSKYILGIECDGATYHSSRSARERDIHRQRYLESRGWHIIRIWSRAWWAHPKEEIKRIEQAIERLSCS